MNAKLSALFLALSMSASASKLFTDPSMLNADWQTTVVLQQGTTTLNFLDFATQGNPGLASLAVLAIPSLQPGASSSIGVARTRSDFFWDPATDGALGTMRFQLDVRNSSSSGLSTRSGLFYRPVILQDGIIYSLQPSVSLTPTPAGSYETLVWELTSNSGWFGSTNPSLLPNFSATGSNIIFGMRIGLGGSCPAGASISCNESSVFDLMDNFSVELAQASTSEVPEPGTWTLVSAAGLACFFFKKRRA